MAYADTSALAIPWQPGEPLDLRFQRVLTWLEDRGHRPELPGDARAWPGARYVVWRSGLGARAVSHLAFVVEDDWDEACDERFIEGFHHLPATPATDAPLRRFHVVGPSTGAPAWYFSNAWFGVLESQLWLDLAELPWEVAAIDQYVQRVADRFVAFDVLPDAAPTLAELDLAFERLRAERGLGHTPLASLVGLGLLLGDRVTALDERLVWVTADEAHATLFGLQLAGGAGEALRPIDYLLAAWHADREQVISSYVRVVEERLAAR